MQNPCVESYIGLLLILCANWPRVVRQVSDLNEILSVWQISEYYYISKRQINLLVKINQNAMNELLFICNYNAFVVNVM